LKNIAQRIEGVRNTLSDWQERAAWSSRMAAKGLTRIIQCLETKRPSIAS